MRRFSNRILIASTCVTLAVAPPGWAQEDEESGGMLVDFLEDTLSGEGRQIKVRGVEGALSAKATIEQIVVSDDDGPWLTINDAVLDWNRLALIRGRFSVNELTAREIRVERTPAPTTQAEPLPDAGTQPFQLPELPVAIEIGEIRVDTLGLGEPLIGLAAELKVQGDMTLADGTLDTNLAITRLDRPGDAIKLKAGFQNETSQIALDLQVIEDAGGLISTALKMPGQPPLLLTAKGEGPVTDFTADLSLASDDAERLSGQVRLRGVPFGEDEAENSIAFSADLGGDVTPFLEQEFDTFFGTNTQLQVEGVSDPDGHLAISKLDVSSDALKLKGELDLAAGGTLNKVALQGRITPPTGDKVVLPVADPRITLEAAQFSALLNRETGNHWDLSLTADALETPDIVVKQARITGQGTLDQGEAMDLRGDVQAVLNGLAFADPALTQAVGPSITLDGFFDLVSGNNLNLSDVVVSGSDYTAKANAEISGLQSGFEVDGTVNVKAGDLSRFSGVAQRDLAGNVTADLTGKGAPLGGSFDFKLDVAGEGLKTGMTEIDPIIAGRTTITLDAVRDQQGLEVRKLTVEGQTLRAEAAAKLTGTDGAFAVDGTAEVEAQDLSVFSGLAGRDLAGAVQASVAGKGDMASQHFDVKLNAKAQDLSSGMAEIDPLITGRTTIVLDAKRDDSGIDVRQFSLDGKAVNAKAVAKLTGTEGAYALSGNASVNAPDLSLFSALAGQDLTGNLQAKATGMGDMASRQFDMQLNATARDVTSGIPQVDELIQGQTTLDLDAANSDQGLNIRTFELAGTALSAEASGNLQDADGSIRFQAALDELKRVIPTLSGPLTLTGDVKPTGNGLTGNVKIDGPESSTVALNGTVGTDGSADVNFDANLQRLQRLVPELVGALTAKGNAKRDNGVWAIDADANGPSGLTGKVAGSFDESSGQADVTAKGTIGLGIANLFISPNSIDGAAQYDLALKGTPSVEAVTGTITASGTTVAIPSAGQTLTDIGGRVALANGSATIGITGGLRSGGTFNVSGPVELSPPFNGRIAVNLNELVLTDNVFFETSANGQITMAGPLAGNSAITGQIVFGETNIDLSAASGAVGAAPIPEIRHVGETSAEFTTRKWAKLVQTSSGSSGPVISLDVSLLAPNKVYARGRGLQSELGGRIHVGGTTAAVAPSGQIELIRGNFDILGRRLKLTKGIVTLQGNLTPYLEFASTTTTSDGTATLEISGPLDGPEIKVYSDPERPSEEALAMLLFGNRFSELSPFVIAQMAASLAQLSGAGGDSTKGIREATGADTIDVGTDDSGAGQFGAGAYLADGLYTDFTVNTKGETELNLNLDVTESFTLKGTVDNQGETSVGVFFERDY